MFIEFLVEADNAVGESEFQKLDEFSVGILQTLMTLVQVEMPELITCSATDTGMLVKRALTSNEIKVSSSGFIKRCLIYWIVGDVSLERC